MEWFSRKTSIAGVQISNWMNRSGRRYRSLAHLQLHALNSDDPIEPRFDEKVSWSMS
jgi:hypothetical protein